MFAGFHLVGSPNVEDFLLPLQCYHDNLLPYRRYASLLLDVNDYVPWILQAGMWPGSVQDQPISPNTSLVALHSID